MKYSAQNRLGQLGEPQNKLAEVLAVPNGMLSAIVELRVTVSPFTAKSGMYPVSHPESRQVCVFSEVHVLGS